MTVPCHGLLLMHLAVRYTEGRRDVTVEIDEEVRNMADNCSCPAIFRYDMILIVASVNGRWPLVVAGDFHQAIVGQAIPDAVVGVPEKEWNTILAVGTS